MISIVFQSSGQHGDQPHLNKHRLFYTWGADLRALCIMNIGFNCSIYIDSPSLIGVGEVAKEN